MQGIKTMTSNPKLDPGSLQDELECPVCYKIPTSIPIFQCQQGHIHCGDCHPKLTTCPICRTNLNTKTRSLLAEKLLAKIPLDCPFNGCNETLYLESFNRHKINCLFQMVKCPVLTCNQEFVVNDIMNHLKEELRPQVVM